MSAAVVDWHAHWVPPEVVAWLSARRAPPRIVREDGVRHFDALPGIRLALKEPQLDLDVRLAEMDRCGVARQVLSLAVVLGCFLSRLPGEHEGALIAANNAGVARLVAERGDRFSALAALPLAHLDEAPAVLEKAVVEQGLLGAILPADGFGDKAAASRFADVFAMADRLGAHLFIHPGPLPGAAMAKTAHGAAPEDEAQMIRHRAVGFQDSLTAATITFEYTDFLDPYPNARVHLANLGGSIALLAERIAMTADRMALPEHLTSGHLRRTFVDTASFGRRGVALAADVLGAERLVFGTDSPALAIAPGLEGVRIAGLGAQASQAVLAGRAFSPPFSSP